MNVRELRRLYIEFFKSKGHQQFPSGSLVPYDVTGKLDESLLFNGAGMVQFKPYFRGVAQPPSPRLTTAQKCVRTGDIESVGNLSHLTFFEMLGNFSFGDYFKEGAIAYSWEFLTSKEWLGLDPHKLSFTVFEEDDEAFEHWSKHLRSVGIDPETRVFRLGEETNYWPAGAFSNGPPGPCGPNTEMFYWVAETPPPSGPYTREDWLRDDAAQNWLEIWNDVFIQYEWKGRLKDPSRPNEGYVKEGMDNLPFQSVDTGMGLDRTAAVLGGWASVYETDAFQPILKLISGLANEERLGSGEGPRHVAARIIADHIRTAVFCIADGILPSNTGRGYVLRRLIRRAVLKGHRVLGLGDVQRLQVKAGSIVAGGEIVAGGDITAAGEVLAGQGLFMHGVYEGVIEALGDHYSELIERREVIVETLKNEEAMFRRKLHQGIDRVEVQIRAGIYYLLDLLGPELFPSLSIPAPVQGAFLEIGQRDVPRLGRSAQLKFEHATEVAFPTLASIGGFRRSLIDSARGIAITRAQRDAVQQAARMMFHGGEAFELYDTYGFPLEVTQELAEEAGLTVDLDGYEAALKEAQERSRAGSDMDAVYTADDRLVVSASDAGPTTFLGYGETLAEGRIVRLSPAFGADGRATGDLLIALDQTPFYAESGGQVGDTGTVGEWTVRNTRKEAGTVWHETTWDALRGLNRDEAEARLKVLLGQTVTAKVDADRRRRITRNHSATHLLHAALREVLGKHVTQAGSLVAPDHLRFDFTHGKAMSPDEIAEVERIVNEKALAGDPVDIQTDVPIAEAKKLGAMALFGEKYGDSVRVVKMGESIELCGGCHVRNTSEVGLFKIVGESSAASGVRRIEAITGEASFEWVREQSERLKEAAALLKAQPSDLVPAVNRTLEALKEEKRRVDKLRSQGSGAPDAAGVTLGPVELVRVALRDAEQQDAAAAADRLADGNPGRVVLVGLVADGKASFIAKVGAQAQAAGVHAGNLVREVAKIAGGGGGGRPDFATAGGKDPSKLDDALAAAEDLVRGMLKQ